MADTEMQQELKKVRDDLASLQKDVAQVVSTLKEVAAGEAGKVSRSVQDELRARREALRRQLDSARAYSDQAIEEVGDTVGRNPISSMLLAFGVGFIMAKLMDLGGRR
jgi:ElaB/YqjD/DUF883 family membrane-anchored ribosome-binding protein